MKHLTQYILEKFKIKKDIKLENNLDDSFINTLDAIINDFEGPKFKSEWSLMFLYNIFCAAMPSKAKVIHTAYDKKGERLNDLEMCTILCGKNTFKIEEDTHGQLRFTDNGKFIDVFGSKRKTEFNFGLNLINDVFGNSNCKNFNNIQSKKLSDNEITKLLYIGTSKVDCNIYYYDINGWKVYNGYIYEKNVSRSLSNCIYISIVLPDDEDYDKLYVAQGEGLHGSKINYNGKNEDDFIDTVNELIYSHLGIK